jgi:hypothetical protein
MLGVRVTHWRIASSGISGKIAELRTALAAPSAIARTSTANYLRYLPTRILLNVARHFYFPPPLAAEAVLAFIVVAVEVKAWFFPAIRSLERLDRRCAITVPVARITNYNGLNALDFLRLSNHVPTCSIKHPRVRERRAVYMHPSRLFLAGRVAQG